ncbi:diguanylate phosphodiesterase [Scytonema hofmannii PCC 7110]|uniref:Diguanylate phosphodiesterase n=1 Tax=Scytonema hofmannii PCC 7110 TaxID=128403 RepID=A0A139XBA5_9CYAN|nr:EAL domain-containing protein [Scytonema hofmannii]KYC41936.1 diguanylate phosphodiesterase [Scytonema hofmannii PCC 7110]
MVKLQSYFPENVEKNTYIEIIKSSILPNISTNIVFNRAHHGIYQIHEVRKGEAHAFVVIPLIPPPEAEFMIICRRQQDSNLLGDVYGRIVSSFYKASEKMILQPELVEASILDDLKKDFGFVSLSLYERRFELFCERLKRMVVHFEPILHLYPEELYISGWEALARNPDNWKAPSDLFQSAELWVSRFIIELDQHFLIVAARSYSEACRTAKQSRQYEVLPLSVNVYPESLMRRAYFQSMRQLLQERLISPRKLILEISEKTELPKFDGDILLDSPLDVFKEKLLQYVRDLKIRFAIDDFGVGYASVSRLAGLNPPYVKIDREILYQESTEVIIQFVHKLVQADNLRSTTDVILEGIDENTPISLHRLKQIGVSYIQGHIVGKAGAEIYRLTPEKSEFLRKKLLEPTD